MKKLIAVLCMVFLTVLFVAGCGESDKQNLPATIKNDEWVEVQSITYYYNQGSSKTLTSAYIIEKESEEVTESEYNNATDEQKVHLSTFLDISINRKEVISKLEERVGKYYFYDYINLRYYKYFITSYELYYVRVRFLDNNVLEINYNDYNVNQYGTPESYNTTIRVLPLSYTINYFND